MTAAAEALVVRAITAEDYRAWVALWSDHSGGGAGGETALDTRRLFEDMVKGAAHTPYGVIAERDGQAVGVAQFRRPRTRAEAGDLSLLQDMYVVPGPASAGVAYALTAAVPMAPTGQVRALIASTFRGRKAA
ncbi:MAG: GNAT family N-acetyltransferase [Shimia sp.]